MKRRARDTLTCSESLCSWYLALGGWIVDAIRTRFALHRVAAVGTLAL
jgi:hypothetical protein